MGKDDMIDLAQRRTPDGVNVPREGYSGLIVWAVGEFGGMIVAVALMVMVYFDQKEAKIQADARMYEFMLSRMKLDADLNSTITNLRQSIADMAMEARNAHNNRPRSPQ
jgi:hypothetical protein